MLFVAAKEHYSSIDYFNEFLGGILTDNPWLILNRFPTLVTQAWTNSVELSFYFILPLLVFIRSKSLAIHRILCCCLFIFPIASYILGYDFPTYRYRCVFGCLFTFIIGMVIAYHKEKLPKLKRPLLYTIILLILYIVLFAFGTHKHELLEWKISIAFIIQILILICSAQIVPKKELIPFFPS